MSEMKLKKKQDKTESWNVWLQVALRSSYTYEMVFITFLKSNIN